MTTSPITMNLQRHMFLLAVCFLATFSITLSSKLRGHLQPMGSHRPPEGTIDEVDGFIEPQEFFHKYVKASKPLLFRGAAKDSPTFKKWNDAYLKEKFGNLSAVVESGKKENREAPGFDWTVGKFIDNYNKSSIYMVQDVHKEMREDVCLPKPLFCGGFQDVLQTAVIWFSSGGTRSLLHHDDVDNINCLLDGDKEFIMYDKKLIADIQADGYNFEKGYSWADVDKVDFDKFPRLANLPWWKGRMEKGDCLFIPWRWFHQVNSAGRNLAINLWFYHLFDFDESDCIALKDDLKKNYIPLSKYEFAGTGSPETVRSEIFGPFEGQQTISVGDVIEKHNDALTPEEAQQFVKMMDMNKDTVLTWDEVAVANMEMLLNLFPIFAGDDDGVEDGAEPTGAYGKKTIKSEPGEDTVAKAEDMETNGEEAAAKEVEPAAEYVDSGEVKVGEDKPDSNEKSSEDEEEKATVKSADSKPKKKPAPKEKAAAKKEKSEAKAKTKKASTEETKSKKAKPKKPTKKKGKKKKKGKRKKKGKKKKGKKSKKGKKKKKKAKKSKKGKKKTKKTKKKGKKAKKQKADDEL